MLTDERKERAERGVSEASKGQRWKITCALLICGALCLPGCDWAKSQFAELRDQLVSAHREAAKSRVGALRAMEVVDQAMTIVVNREVAGDPLCGRPPSGPLDVTLTLALELMKEDSQTPIAVLKETRTLRRDRVGNVGVEFKSSSRGLTKTGGMHERVERIVGKRWFVSEQGLPFVERGAHKGDAETLLRESMDGIPAIASLGGAGWGQDPSSGDAVYVASETAGGVEIMCGLGAEEGAWLTRLTTLATLSYAELELMRDAEGYGERLGSSRLLVEDKHGEVWVVRIEVEERVGKGSGDALLKPPSQVVSLARDRPYQDIVTILGKRLGLTDWNGAPRR